MLFKHCMLFMLNFKAKWLEELPSLSMSKICGLMKLKLTEQKIVCSVATPSWFLKFYLASNL